MNQAVWLAHLCWLALWKCLVPPKCKKNCKLQMFGNTIRSPSLWFCWFLSSTLLSLLREARLMRRLLRPPDQLQPRLPLCFLRTVSFNKADTCLKHLYIIQHMSWTCISPKPICFKAFVKAESSPFTSQTKFNNILVAHINTPQSGVWNLVSPPQQ